MSRPIFEKNLTWKLNYEISIQGYVSKQDYKLCKRRESKWTGYLWAHCYRFGLYVHQIHHWHSSVITRATLTTSPRSRVCVCKPCGGVSPVLTSSETAVCCCSCRFTGTDWLSPLLDPLRAELLPRRALTAPLLMFPPFALTLVVCGKPNTIWLCLF